MILCIIRGLRVIPPMILVVVPIVVAKWGGGWFVLIGLNHLGNRIDLFLSILGIRDCFIEGVGFREWIFA